MALWAGGAWAQVWDWDRESLGPPEASLVTPRFEIEYTVPQVHKWYAPRHLMESYARPWHAVEARYGRDFYSRYVSSLLEGDEFYDPLGNPVGRGWLVYTWNQQQPQPRGSDIVKIPARAARNVRDVGFGFDAYGGFFNKLVIASDGDDRGTYRLMVGDEIYTRFTPLTFYKPRFNGVRLDYATESYATTLLLSRASDPDGLPLNGLPPQPGVGERTNVTHLTGGHADWQAGDRATLGFTYISTRNAETQLTLNNGNPLNGTLTTNQNQALRRLWVRLRDDSPSDRRGGATLIAHDIVLVDTSGQELRGSQIDFQPSIEGGVVRAGLLVADGSESILLEYDLSALDYEGIKSADLRQATVELTLANDYRVEVASNLQTEDIGKPGVVFLPAQRAVRNVQDKSNARVLQVDYGLPTASEIVGMNWDLVEWMGLSAQGEMVLNRRHSRYPNPAISRHHQIIRQAHAAYVTAAYRRFGWKLSFEGFSMEDGYSTTYWLTESSGVLRYRAAVPEVYELVDDDDDQDAVPEWERPFQPSDRVAWPGYDENGDFLNDHNQNANLIPDYEEPFLRFRSDRPEFLFGLDMNHNGTVDRFENDDLPDYPYKKDHRGFNAHARIQLIPELHLTLGHQRMRLIAGDGRTHAWYLLGTWEHLLDGGGRLRVFEHGALVWDDIPDDLIQWFQPVDALGRMQEVEDALPAINSWKNSLYADLDQRFGAGIRLQHRIKWDLLVQRDGKEELVRREGRPRGGFLGMINKAEWSLPLGLAVLEPRFKSEYRRDRPFSVRLPASESLEETFTLLWTQPLLAEKAGVGYFPRYGRQLFNSELQVGLEASWFWLWEGRRQEIDEDFSRRTGIAQLTNRTAYEGYQVITRVGLRLSWWTFERSRGQSTSMFFMTVNAGLK